MDSYFGAMREVIESVGGTVEKFIGDAIMSVFGVPVAHEDDPVRALRAALRMRERLSTLNATLTETHGVALEMRIGINSGEVLAVTEPKAGEAMVAGDAVNVAARLQQTAEPGQIVVAERVARATRGFRFEEVGAPLELKGKGVGVRAVRLLGDAPRVDAGGAGLQAPLVGRDAEMALLDTLYDRVTRERRPNLVSIYGDPGVGKSRLVAEFLQRRERTDDPPLILSGRCLPYGDCVTYWPLAEILKGLAGVFDTDPPETVVDKIRKLGGELLTSDVTSEPARATAALAFTVGVEDPETSFTELPPRQVRAEMHAAWRSFFSALAADRPVVLMVEDIHWADAAMLDLLEEVADRTQGPLLIVCPTRPELTTRRPAWGGGRRNYSSMFLDPLTAGESQELVAAFLATEDLPPKLAQQILDRAEGNPFFLEEILRHLIDEGVLVRDGDRCRASGDAVEVVLPDTVQGALAARIDLLSTDEKRVIQSAAVVGRVFWAGVVAQLLDKPADEVEEIIDRLEGRELVRAHLASAIGGDREYIFKHVLTREVAYESIPRRERSSAHARTADWLEATTEGRHAEFAELLAYHFFEAFRPLEADSRAGVVETERLRGKALDFMMVAAHEAGAKLVLAKAQQLGEQALHLARDSIERSRALVELGNVHRDNYIGDRAWASFCEAVDERVKATPDDHAAIVELCAMALDIPTRWPGGMRNVPSERDVMRYLKLGMEHASFLEGDSVALVRLLTSKSFYAYGFPGSAESDEELDAAMKDGIRAAEIARRLGRPDLESGALDGATSNLMAQDKWGSMDDMMNRRIQLADVIRDPWELGDIFAMRAWMHFMQGRYLEAIRSALEGLDRIGADASAPSIHCLSWCAMARYRLGSWGQFQADMARLEEVLGDRRHKPPHFAYRPYAAAAVVHEIQGNRAAADVQLEIISETDRAQRAGRGGAAPWTALVLSRRGDYDEALKKLALADNTAGGRQYHSLTLEARAEVVAEGGLWAQASGLAKDMRAHANTSKALDLPLAADRLEGLAAVAAERWNDAVTFLTRASAGYAEIETRWDEARTDVALAEALIATDQRDEAARRLQKAAATFERLNALREGARASELLATLS